MSSNLHIPKVCQFCGKAFVARTTVTQFCGDNCSKKGYKKRIRDAKVQTAIIETQQTLQSLQSPQTSISNQNYNTSAKAQVNINFKAFLSVQEAAELIGASRWTIQRLINSDKLKAAKIGRRTIINRTEIDKLF